MVRFLPLATTLCLLGAPVSNAADAGVCAIIAKPAAFDHQSVTLQGSVSALKETTSRRGNDYTTFKLQDPSGCGAVTIFTWGRARVGFESHEARAIRRTSSMTDAA